MGRERRPAATAARRDVAVGEPVGLYGAAGRGRGTGIGQGQTARGASVPG